MAWKWWSLDWLNRWNLSPESPYRFFFPTNPMRWPLENTMDLKCVCGTLPQREICRIQIWSSLSTQSPDSTSEQNGGSGKNCELQLVFSHLCGSLFQFPTKDREIEDYSTQHPAGLVLFGMTPILWDRLESPTLKTEKT